MFVRRKLPCRSLAVLAGLALFAPACGGGDDDSAAVPEVAAFEQSADGRAVLAAAERDVVSFVGKVADSNAYIAVVKEPDGNVLTYVCDGEKVAAWATGPLDGASFGVVAPSGLRVDGTIDGQTSSGTVTTTDGKTLAFNAAKSTFPAGLWQPILAPDSPVGRVGWIVLADGSQRGAASAKGTVSVVEGVDTAGGTSGADIDTAPAGPTPPATTPVVQDLSKECQTILGSAKRAVATAYSSTFGSRLYTAAFNHFQTMQEIWNTRGCPGNLRDLSQPPGQG